MLKKNLVIVIGGVISLLIFLVLTGVIVLSLLGAPATTSGETAPQQTENAH